MDRPKTLDDLDALRATVHALDWSAVDLAAVEPHLRALFTALPLGDLPHGLRSFVTAYSAGYFAGYVDAAEGT